MAARITLPMKKLPFFGFFLGVSPCLDKLIHQPGTGFFNHTLIPENDKVIYGYLSISALNIQRGKTIVGSNGNTL